MSAIKLRKCFEVNYIPIALLENLGSRGGGTHILMDMYVPPYVKKKGAYGADQTEKVGAFRAERTVKVVPLGLSELGKVGAFRKSECFKS